jgi:antirestriction protein
MISWKESESGEEFQIRDGKGIPYKGLDTYATLGIKFSST